MIEDGSVGMVMKPYESHRDRRQRCSVDRHQMPGCGILIDHLRPRVHSPRPENLERLRKRSLDKKRNFDLQKHALGYEGLKHYTSANPLHAVHECVFSLLALESEPVDPRL